MIQNNVQAKPNDFRLDINGLRAWAVLAVVFYHFGVPGFDGGFVGVDVFFVISGYLMTRIISQDLERGIFGFGQFYLSRAKRIVPALLALCMTLLGAGWFLLFPADYRELAKEALAATLFISNFKFIKDAGYFDVAAHEKWLLHSWSLSVEWQFYLLLPLMFAGIWHFRRHKQALLVLTMLVALVSFVWSVGLSDRAPTSAFYTLTSRAWEMLAGALVFLLSDTLRASESWAKKAELLGFVLIIFAIAAFDAHTSWPGAWAAVPVLGAVLVLWAGRQRSIWTALPVAQWFGKTSYSLYLWHWPVAVVLVYLGLQTNPWAMACGVGASIFLGWGSWRWIEEITRSLKWPARKWLLFFVIALCSIAGATISIYTHKGFESRVPQALLDLARGAQDKNPRLGECLKSDLPQPHCTFGGAVLGAIVVGDSHGASIVRTVEQSLPQKRLHVLDWSLSSCPTILGLQGVTGYRACPEFVPDALRQSAVLPSFVPLIVMNRLSVYPFGQHNAVQEEFLPYYFGPDPIRFIDRDDAYLQQFRQAVIETTCAFAKTRPVYLVRPIPEMPVDVPRSSNAIGGRFLRGKTVPDISISLHDYHQRHAWAWEVQDAAAKQCGAKILDPLPYLCWDGRCHGIKNGKALYYDDDHLSETGARLLLPMFRSVFAPEPSKP